MQTILVINKQKGESALISNNKADLKLWAKKGFVSNPGELKGAENTQKKANAKKKK